MNSSKALPHRNRVRIAAFSVAAVWLIMLLMLAFIIYGAATNLQGTFVIGVALGAPFTIIICGATYLTIALRTYCPNCGFKFLKNPKGFGPANFSYHSNCPRGRGINPWGHQILRLVRTGRITCINCGEEVFQ